MVILLISHLFHSRKELISALFFNCIKLSLSSLLSFKFKGYFYHFPFFLSKLICFCFLSLSLLFFLSLSFFLRVSSLLTTFTSFLNLHWTLQTTEIAITLRLESHICRAVNKLGLRRLLQKISAKRDKI